MNSTSIELKLASGQTIKLSGLTCSKTREAEPKFVNGLPETFVIGNLGTAGAIQVLAANCDDSFFDNAINVDAIVVIDGVPTWEIKNMTILNEGFTAGVLEVQYSDPLKHDFTYVATSVRRVR